MPAPAHSATDTLPIWRSVPTRPVAIVTAAVLTGLLIVVNGVAPMSMPFIVVACGVMQLYWAGRDGRVADARVPWSSLAWIAPFLGWWVVSLAWSSNTSEGAGAAFSLALFVVAAGVALALFDVEATDVHRAVLVAIIAAFVALAVYRAIDQLSGLAVTTTAIRRLPALASTIDIARDATGQPIVVGFATNKGVAWLVVLLFPVLLGLRDVVPASALPAARIVLALLVATAVAWSEHETSKLALLFGALIFGLARRFRALTWRSLALGWGAAVILAVPFALLAWHANLHKSSSMQTTGQHRVLIWGVTAERTLKAPIIGYGIASTRTHERHLGDTAPTAEGTAFKLTTNLHAHNVFLQTWHELGAIGALFLLLAGWPALRWLRDAPPDIAPFASATFAVCGVTASLSWSLVAAWFLALFAFAAILTVYVARPACRKEAPLPRSVPVS